MGKVKPGNAANCKENGQWGRHVRRWMKKVTSGKRRTRLRKIIHNIKTFKDTEAP